MAVQNHFMNLTHTVRPVRVGTLSIFTFLAGDGLHHFLLYVSGAMLATHIITLLLSSIAIAAPDHAPVTPPNTPSNGTSILSSFSATTPNTGTSTPTPTLTTGSTSTSSTPSAIPTDLESIYQRRLTNIVGSLNVSQVPEISTWLSSLDSSGKWPDVDYTTGCAAQRANWPAGGHWIRLQLMAAAYHGGLLGADQYVKNQAILDSTILGMNYWFSRDFTNPACLFQGGSAACPCSNPDNLLWNTNWFSNVILVPNLVGQTCLLLNETLAPLQSNNCSRITSRSYKSFLDSSLKGYLTGANALDIAKIGIDGGLLTINATQIGDAFDHIHSQIIIQNATTADGIRPDGSFGQHNGLMYNGNYGKDFTNDVLDFEVEASDTQFAASPASRAAFETLFNGDRWMIYRNSLTGVNHWDFSALGRFISFAVADEQATASININLTQVEVLGELWSSSNLTTFAQQLSKNTTNANAGFLKGNRMFFANDYMVHRGENYVSTLKMYSSRTRNSECLNTQNPFGFHLSDGTLYTYLDGNEYEDIAAAWDWNLVPGITVDYGATQLDCSHNALSGLEGFVGGVSDGNAGLAVMRYTNPLTKSLRWQKAWFFFPDDIQHIMVNSISSTTNASVRTVLDQRLHKDKVVLNGAIYDPSSPPTIGSNGTDVLWHGGVGYVIEDDSNSLALSLQIGSKSGSWQNIGTSTQPPTTVDLFTAWLEHRDLSKSVSYTAYPGTSLEQFLAKSTQKRPITIENDDTISAAYDSWNKIFMAAFWQVSGGSVTFTPSTDDSSITIAADANVALIYRLETGDITVADPSQMLASVQLNFTLGCEGRAPPSWGNEDIQEKAIVFTLPTGGVAGSSITKKLE